jgi:hypothetical protein
MNLQAVKYPCGCQTAWNREGVRFDRPCKKHRIVGTLNARRGVASAYIA